MIILLKLTFKYFVNLTIFLLTFQTLFDYIRRKFHLAQSDEISSDCFEYLFIQVNFLKLKHILYQVVTVGVFNEIVKLVNDNLSQCKFLLLSTFLKTALHNTAPVLM